MVANLEKKSKNSNRIAIIDIIRAVCIILMVLDHFVLIYFKLYQASPELFDGEFMFEMMLVAKNVFFSDARYWIRWITVAIFFGLSGYCTGLSRNNYKRALKLGIVAVIINIVTITVSELTVYNISVHFGVIHFYAAAVLIWQLLSIIKVDVVKLVILVMLVLASIVILVLKPTIQGDWLIPLGIPAADYVYGFDYFPIFPYIMFFIAGGLICSYSNGRVTRIGSNKAFAPLRFIGRYGIVFYVLQFPLIISIIFIVNAIK